ncbi:hypothetical protein AcV7_003910 [Taiwanofungus camphoratus]|nr:hypothetical protein AcV7_003910 [Antrodia cinnamomea]
MSTRPLSTLPLAQTILSTLARGGYETEQDLSTLTPETLSKDLNIPLSSSQAVFSSIQTRNAAPMTQSVASIVGATRKYSSQCAPLDRLLGGGLKCGHIIELSGPPGCAKEMLATAIVQSFVESKEEVLFVDMQNMVSPAILNKALRKSPTVPSEYQKLVRYLSLQTLPDLIIFLRNLPSYLELHPKIALLVLSSLSFPFQSLGGPNTSNRYVILEGVKQTLTKACSSRNLTVVITSQLANKLLNPDGSAATFDTGSRAVMMPQLGNAYLPSGRTYRVIIVPQTRTTGVVRLLSSPIHVPGRGPVSEERYRMVQWTSKSRLNLLTAISQCLSYSS